MRIFFTTSSKYFQDLVSFLKVDVKLSINCLHIWMGHVTDDEDSHVTPILYYSKKIANVKLATKNQTYTWHNCLEKI